MKSLFLTVVMVLSCVLGLQGQTTADPVYSLSWDKEIPIFGLGFGSYFLGNYLHSDLEALTAPQIAGLDSNLISKFDRVAIRHWNPEIGTVSDYLVYGAYLSPFLLYLGENTRKNWAPCLTMYFEAFVMQIGVTNFIKNGVRRNRPLLYNPAAPMDQKLKRDARASFWSGHSVAAGTFSFLTAKMYSDLYPDSKWKPLVWTGAILYPTTVATARVLAGKHFPTDVITGAGMGMLIGWLIPYTHKWEEKHGLSVYPMGGNNLGLGFTKRF